MENKENEWKNIFVSFGGIPVTGITEIEYQQSYTLEQLNEQLNNALEVENYELCEKIRIQIVNFNKE